MAFECLECWQESKYSSAIASACNGLCLQWFLSTRISACSALCLPWSLPGIVSACSGLCLPWCLPAMSFACNDRCSQWSLPACRQFIRIDFNLSSIQFRYSESRDSRISHPPFRTVFIAIRGSERVDFEMCVTVLKVVAS